jgi:hypothetical protein
LTQLARTIRATPNKGRMHVFLGHPDSDGADKTTVEPGNSFSPGLWTCGVSLWVETSDSRVWTPDTLEDDAVTWGFTSERDGPPVLDARWPAGKEVEVTSRLCHLGGTGAEGVDFCEVVVAASEGAGRVEGVSTLVVRDIGPAGAKLESLDWDAGTLTLQVGGGPRIVVEDAPQAVVIVPADAEFDSPLALLRYPFTLVPGQTLTLSFKAEHGFAGQPFADQIPLQNPHNALTVEQGIMQSGLDWIGRGPGRLICPDSRLARVWERSAYHLQAAMENGLPRIGVANYPAFWMRDGVLVLRALDVMGRADLGRAGCEYLAPLLFSGGFGAEADAPGEGIWALVSHAQITQDFAWLAPHFSQIQRRVEWLERMIEADAPVRHVGENRLPAYGDTPGVNLLCLASQNGLIRGRMDWHSPDFYLNCWAVAGFRLAAQAAGELGKHTLARAWADRADRLEDALAKHLLPTYGNERDPIVAPHPTSALAGHRADLRAKFETWFRTHRLGPDGMRRAERLWTYFEVAQIHNAFRLGLDDLAWTSLDGLLGEGGTASWDVSAFGEGLPGGAEFLPYRNGEGRRGWLDLQTAQAGNMPHGWTAAEWILLLRDLFVRDDGDRLVLGPHIARAWRLPGARFGARDLPTRFGLVSYLATVGDDGEIDLEYDGPEDYEAGWS